MTATPLLFGVLGQDWTSNVDFNGRNKDHLFNHPFSGTVITHTQKKSEKKWVPFLLPLALKFYQHG
jgi:hypothetical protein